MGKIGSVHFPTMSNLFYLAYPIVNGSPGFYNKFSVPIIWIVDTFEFFNQLKSPDPRSSYTHFKVPQGRLIILYSKDMQIFPLEFKTGRFGAVKYRILDESNPQ